MRTLPPGPKATPTNHHQPTPRAWHAAAVAVLLGALAAAAVAAHALNGLLP